MKRLFITFFALWSLSIGIFASSERSNTSNALFLTDKMAYELRLTVSQRADVYEINYDFLNAVDNVLTEALAGESWALDEYYDALDIRNDDMRYVLSNYQYRLFLAEESFCRPIYQTSSGWKLRVYLKYPDKVRYYYPKPGRYSSYYGEHYRSSFKDTSYYCDRYPNTAHNTIVFRQNVKGYYYNDYAKDFKNGGYKVTAKKGYDDRESLKKDNSDNNKNNYRSNTKPSNSGKSDLRKNKNGGQKLNGENRINNKSNRQGEDKDNRDRRSHSRR